MGTADHSSNNGRDSSTMRLRQLIAFKQQNSKSIAAKDGKMMDKLKPYFNRVRMNNNYTDQTDKNVNRVILEEKYI